MSSDGGAPGQNLYRDTPAAVLGASGFIGRWVARALDRRGAQLQLVVRDKTAATRTFEEYGIHGEVIEADLAHLASVRQLLERIKPSIIFNLVGYGVDPTERDEAQAYRINSELVADLCDAVAERGAPAWRGQHIVHVGSALEYGTAGGNLSEDMLPEPTTPYGRSKLTGTLALARRCATGGISGVTVRLFTVYGPGEHQGRLLPSLLEAARRGTPIRLTAGWHKRDFTYVEDVAEGLLRLGAGSAPPGAVVNLATGRLTSIRSFVETAAGILGILRKHLEFGVLPTRPEEMEHEDVTVDRLLALTGWVPPTPIDTGIRRTVEWTTPRRVR